MNQISYIFSNIYIVVLFGGRHIVNKIALLCTVYPKKYAHGFCFVVLCCGYTLTDFPISIRLTWLALWQTNDCPSASKATLMNMDKYFMWIHYERLRNHNNAKHNKTVCIFLGIYCIFVYIYIKCMALRYNKNIRNYRNMEKFGSEFMLCTVTLHKNSSLSNQKNSAPLYFASWFNQANIWVKLLLTNHVIIESACCLLV